MATVKRYRLQRQLLPEERAPIPHVEDIMRKFASKLSQQKRQLWCACFFLPLSCSFLFFSLCVSLDRPLFLSQS